MRLPRLPTTRRAKDPPRMEFTKRRKAIVASVDKYKLLSTSLIEVLHFPPGGSHKNSTGRPRKSRSATRTLKLMYHNGLLSRAQQPTVLGQGTKEMVYHLPRPPELWKISKKGRIVAVKYPEAVAALKEVFGFERDELYAYLKKRQYDGKRKSFDHPLAINQVRIHFELGARAHGWKILKWIDDPTLHKQGNYDRVLIPKPTVTNPAHTKEIPLIPDGYAVLGFSSESGQSHFCLEVDLGNLYVKRWEERVKGYLTWYSNGMYTKRYGAESLRVLTVCPGAERLTSLKKVTERAAQELNLPGLAGIFWYSTYEKTTWPTFFTAPIWQVAGTDSSKGLVSASIGSDPALSDSDHQGEENSGISILSGGDLQHGTIYQYQPDQG